jgi:hypothetical protein
MNHHPMTAHIIPHIAERALTAAEIGDACGYELWRVLTHLGWMLRRGLVEATGNQMHRYRATPAGVATARQEASPYAEAAP